MPDGKWPGESYEARIDRLSGQCPEAFDQDWWATFRDWPFPRVDAAGDEDQETPTDA